MGFPALASDVITHRVSTDEGRYYVYVEMRVDAEPDAVYRVLTDYEHLKALNDSITTSRVLKRDGDEARVLVISEGCILMFCREIKQVQDVTPLKHGLILTRTDPQHSDLELGRVLWRVRAQGDHTIVTYSGDFDPAFWVPPFIGPPLLRDRLVKEAKKTIQGIERVLNEKQ